MEEEANGSQRGTTVIAWREDTEATIRQRRNGEAALCGEEEATWRREAEIGIPRRRRVEITPQLEEQAKIRGRNYERMNEEIANNHQE